MAIAPIGGLPLGPEFSGIGSDFAVPGVAAAPPASGVGAGGGFGAMLEKAVGNLDQLQGNAATASQQLATGQAQDISSVVMQVEQANLSLQLAAQVRNKIVDAYQEIMRMQV